MIGGQKEIRPPAMKYQEIIARMASIDRSLKVIAMKDVLSDTDRMFIVTKLEELKKMLGHNRT